MTDLEMAREIALLVQAAGGHAYFVGGYVRDLLLGRKNKDIDIEVHGITPEALTGILSTLGEMTAFGESFGIFGLRHSSLDIAMPRSERAVGPRHRDFVCTMDPFIGTYQAALRRDFTINALMQDVQEGRFAPCICYKKEENSRRGVPVGYSAVSMRVYSDFPERFEEVRFSSMSELLETFYAQKNEATRIRQKSTDLRRIVQTILERDVHKYDLQCRQIRDTEKRDKYRLYGELLNAYAYSVPTGEKSCEVDNYYTGEKIRIPLDPTLTPAQNAKKYFDRYTKLKRTHEALTKLTAEVKAEIDHLESIRTSLELATNEGDLAQIRQELEDSGLVRRHTGGGKKRPGFDKSGSKKGKARTPVSKPLHYISSDGYDIYVGKNNTQNDQLTFHFAEPNDIWMHANDMPGSHVILRSGGRTMEEIPDRAFEEAASLAAWYSAGREQGKVEIDYLLRRNVKKPGGAKPGFVVYYTNYSILAKADITGLQEVSD